MLKIWCTLLFLAGTVSSLWGGLELSGITTWPESGIDIKLQCRTDDLPAEGVCPLVLTITNRSPVDGQWHISFSAETGWDHSLVSRVQLTCSVRAGEKRVYPVLLPLLPLLPSNQTHDHSLSTTLRTVISGPGIQNNRQERHRYDTIHLSGFAISSKLSDLRRSLIEEMEKELIGSAGHVGTLFDPAGLGEDWRELSAFQSLWLSDSEWSALSSAQRHALLERVAFGARLFLLLDRPPVGADASRLGLGGDQTLLPHGFGIIQLLQKGDPDRDKPLVKQAQLHIKEANGLGQQEAINHWKFLDKVQDFGVNISLFIVFVCAFALIVGPLNLYFFARKKRSRLLWTTPLMSISASVLLLLVIVLQDGLGGEGWRNTLVLLDAQANRSLTIQEQLVRTGALLRSSFELPASSLLQPLRIGGVHHSLFGRSYEVDGNTHTYSGDYFQSRMVQAHLLRDASPGRARVEISPGPLPELTSTHESLWAELFFRDGEEKLWRGTDVSPGRRQLLMPATAQEFEAWITAHSTQLSPHLRALLQQVEGRKNFFFACSSGPAGTPDFLGGIHWTQGEHLVVGEIRRVGANP